MKKKTWNLIKLLVRYLIPAIIGWIEGDTKVVSESLMSILEFFV